MQLQDKEYIINLFPGIQKIKDGGIREKVIATWFHAWKRSNFRCIEDVHQYEPVRDLLAYTNVDHTNQVAQATQAMGELLTERFKIPVEMDALMAGSVLHDVDKIVLFDAQTGGYTETGHRFPHAVMGATMALMEGIPESVAHIIGTHSLKFSPVPPKTIEAIILRHTDHIVAQSYYLARGLDMEKVITEAVNRLH